MAMRPMRRPVLALFGLLAAAVARLGAAEGPPKVATGLLHLPAEGRHGGDVWMYIPNSYEKSKRYALVVVLHPAGLRGRTFAEAWGILAERTGAFVVLAPECKDPEKRLWTLGDEKDLVAVTRKVIGDYAIDPARVLLTGFSQGAIYTYNFGLRNPALFRAIAPVSGVLRAAGTGAEAILKAGSSVPVYICHGLLDDRFPVDWARASRDYLERLGYRVTYREDPQLGHSYPPAEPERIWAWLQGLGAEAAETKAQAEKPERR